MAKNDHLLKYTHYYNGEDKNPFKPDSIKHTFWDMENIWVNFVHDDEIFEDNVAAAFSAKFPNDLEKFKTIPMYLKATMYSQYTRFNEYGDGFEDLLVEYLALAIK